MPGLRQIENLVNQLLLDAVKFEGASSRCFVEIYVRDCEFRSIALHANDRIIYLEGQRLRSGKIKALSREGLGMVVICTYCRRVIKIYSEVDGVSHGICGDCLPHARGECHVSMREYLEKPALLVDNHGVPVAANTRFKVNTARHGWSCLPAEVGRGGNTEHRTRSARGLQSRSFVATF